MRSFFAVAIFSIALPAFSQGNPGRSAGGTLNRGVPGATGIEHVPGTHAIPTDRNTLPAQVVGQTFSRPTPTFSRPEPAFSRPLTTTSPYVFFYADGHGGFRPFVSQFRGRDVSFMGRPLWGPFYSGYSFGHGYGDYNGYGAYGWSGGPNSVIVFNNSDQSREGMLEQPLDAPPQWPVGAAALPMPIGYAPSPYGWVAQSGAMGFPEGMPPIIFAPPQQPADLVVVDFPPGSRVLR